MSRPSRADPVPAPGRRLTLVLIGLVALELTALALDAAFPPDLTLAQRASPVALDRRGEWLRALPVEQGRWRIRADLDRTDPTFLTRLIRVEDARFGWHFGIDPVAVVRAAGAAVLHGRVTSGASTLTMQTARLLEPKRRTFLAKMIQAIRAVQLEARFSKRRILALYLTLAPYGGNLEGVRAASLAWFGHEPQSLTPGEQALLIALPQSPEARRPDRHPAAARAARHAVLATMAREGLLDAEQAVEADAEPLPRRAPFPVLAWHAAGELARAAPADVASVVTTLDAELQRRLEPLAAAAARAQGPKAQVALLAVQIRGRAVRAAVGAAGIGRAATSGDGGWLDMTRALRSPGSTLKPMIYAMAFDDGLAAPDTRLDDAPRRFADYQPEDFDRVFHGPVTAREALMYSLNVPAVSLLARIGPATFEARLRAAGARLSRPKAAWSDPGLALALGGEGVSLRDLALLYGALGDAGLAKPLAWTQAEAAARAREAGVRLMRPAAAMQVLDILREGPAPAGRAPAALTRGGPLMAFKTGTSYGYRDALAIGVLGGAADGWVLAVWTGRADGAARGGLTGRAAALPLLFDMADAVAAPASAPRPIAPRASPPALGRLAQAGDGPRLIFPPDGAVLQAPGFGPASRGLILAAEGEGVGWYVDGAPITRDPVSGGAVWRPAGPGFYRITAIDAQGRQTEARVRVAAGWAAAARPQR